MANLDWLSDLKPKLKFFVESMSENNYGYFRYSYSGDLYNSSIKWGLGNSVFATKILYIIDALNELPVEKKLNLINSIQRFGKGAYYYDPIISGFGKKKQLKKWLRLIPRQELSTTENKHRAESRQTFAALYLLEALPKKPFGHIPKTPSGIETYLESFDWAFPWAAGSHFSHLLFFLKANQTFFKQRIDNTTLINYAKQWVDRVQSPSDGCWYRGADVSMQEKINGAMKVITGLHAAQIYEIPYAKKLIDTALMGANDREACSNFNIAYVLCSCLQCEPTYRRNEIEDFLLERVQIYRQYYYPTYGGFSFNPNRANTVYYGRKISQGKDEPDIHGTIMFTLGLAYIDRAIDLGLHFNIPFN